MFSSRHCNPCTVTGLQQLNGDARSGEGKQLWANCALLWELLCELWEENAYRKHPALHVPVITLGKTTLSKKKNPKPKSKKTPPSPTTSPLICSQYLAACSCISKPIWIPLLRQRFILYSKVSSHGMELTEQRHQRFNSFCLLFQFNNVIYCQVALGGCGCFKPGSAQGWVGWGPDSLVWWEVSLAMAGQG